MEQGLWGPTHWLVVSAEQGWLAPGQDSQGPSRCAGGQCRPFEVRSPVERPQGLPWPFWEEASGEDSHAEPSDHWTRLRIRRDQASGESGTGPGRWGGAGRGGAGADKAWGSCRRRLGERRPPGFVRGSRSRRPSVLSQCFERRAAPTWPSSNARTVKSASPGGNHGVPFGALGCPVRLRGSLTLVALRVGLALWPIR